MLITNPEKRKALIKKRKQLIASKRGRFKKFTTEELKFLYGVNDIGNFVESSKFLSKKSFIPFDAPKKPIKDNIPKINVQWVYDLKRKEVIPNGSTTNNSSNSQSNSNQSGNSNEQ